MKTKNNSKVISEDRAKTIAQNRFLSFSEVLNINNTDHFCIDLEPTDNRLGIVASTMCGINYNTDVDDNINNQVEYVVDRNREDYYEESLKDSRAKKLCVKCIESANIIDYYVRVVKEEDRNHSSNILDPLIEEIYDLMHDVADSAYNLIDNNKEAVLKEAILQINIIADNIRKKQVD